MREHLDRWWLGFSFLIILVIPGMASAHDYFPGLLTLSHWQLVIVDFFIETVVLAVFLRLSVVRAFAISMFMNVVSVILAELILWGTLDFLYSIRGFLSFEEVLLLAAIIIIVLVEWVIVKGVQHLRWGKALSTLLIANALSVIVGAGLLRVLGS
ncbi:MAG: hypothetical protein PHO20_02025 [Candidatus Peribacteraceae bacterium]|nr:hypothetical protein [Candidatus Peribacteraceae bacterium]MDD5739521.1 hypothetical protein [Candidatus Peribacteraceae bacterium]